MIILILKSCIAKFGFLLYFNIAQAVIIKVFFLFSIIFSVAFRLI